MSLTSGFFNSLNGDRKYNADDISSMFDGIITDGIIKNHGEAFAVTANSGNTINIGSGRAWHNHTWTNNDSTMVLITSPADSSLDRIDAVVLEINKSDEVRSNSIKIIAGTPAASPTNPTLTNTIDVLQLPLAYILRPAGSTAVSQANITSMIGTESCPYARPIIDEVEMTEAYTGLKESIPNIVTIECMGTCFDEDGEDMGKHVAEVTLPEGFNSRNCVVLSVMYGTTASTNIDFNDALGWHQGPSSHPNDGYHITYDIRTEFLIGRPLDGSDEPIDNILEVRPYGHDDHEMDYPTTNIFYKITLMKIK